MNILKCKIISLGVAALIALTSTMAVAQTQIPLELPKVPEPKNI